MKRLSWNTKEVTGKFDWNKDIVNGDEIRINITMPNLEKIEAEGYGSIRFEEFTTDDMEIDLRGPVKIRGSLNAHSLSDPPHRQIRGRTFWPGEQSGC